MIILVLIPNSKEADLYKFVRVGFLRNVSSVYDINNASYFRTMDDAMKAKQRATKRFGRDYEIRICSDVNDLMRNAYYVICNNGRYFSQYTHKQPVFSSNPKDAQLYYFGGIGAPDVISSCRHQGYNSKLGILYVNRENPYYDKRYIITCERVNDGKIFFFGGTSYETRSYIIDSEYATSFTLDKVLTFHEKLICSTTGYKYSVIEKPTRNLYGHELLEYLKKNPQSNKIKISANFRL